MVHDYLIIIDKHNDGKEIHFFLETEEELVGMIETCKGHGYEIIFAGKIAVVKEFIG
jgi:hypothetical protein